MKLRGTGSVLAVIVMAQFFCTSLWFAGNAVVTDLAAAFDLPTTALGHLVSAIQLGFITGTLVFALMKVSDRVSPSLVFFFSACVAALSNLAMVFPWNDLTSLLGLRFLTGFFLAGIYPVGMKIAADYHRRGLGRALGYLVGALVLGTALPHLIRAAGAGMPWQSVFYSTSVLSLAGGLLIALLIADGPYRKPSAGMDMTAMFRVFSVRPFRLAAFGYFGHMWEVYTFWAFVPVMLAYATQQPGLAQADVSLLTFFAIASGAIACFAGGWWSVRSGAFHVARVTLLVSFLCCLLSPWFLTGTAQWIVIVFVLVWGMTVVADSPMFSSLVAEHAESTSQGTAITIVVCIGFFITVISIQLMNWLVEVMDLRYVFTMMALGPAIGLVLLFFRKDGNRIRLRHAIEE